jgi:hypothetical protein
MRENNKSIPPSYHVRNLPAQKKLHATLEPNGMSQRIFVALQVQNDYDQATR